MARTPTSMGSRMGRRFMGFTGAPASGTRSFTASGPLSSSGRPVPSSTRPSMASPAGTMPPRPTGTTRALGARPRTSPMGISSSRSWAKPTTSALTPLPAPRLMRQRSPTAASQPAASRVRPTMRVRRPSTVSGRGFSARRR